MSLSRREVLKLLVATATSPIWSPALARVVKVMAAQPSTTPIVWINQGTDHANLLAQLGQQLPDFLSLVSEKWQLGQFPPLAPTGYHPASKSFSSAPVLVLETLPSNAEMAPVKDQENAFRELIGQAKAVILLGTEVCFGGLQVPADDVATFHALCRELKTPVIKLPGIPVPPHHVVGTLAHLDMVGFPRLDAYRRPVMYYGETVCTHCERRKDLENGRFASTLGQAGCLLELGCKGPITHNTCATTRWNGGENWCVGAGGPCTGCSDPGYPNHGGLGLYGRLPADRLGAHSALLRHVDGLGWGLLGLAGAGAAIHLARKLMSNHDEPQEPRKS